MEKLPVRTPWLKQLPNQLTLGRVAVIPILLLLYPLDFHFIKVVCAFLFAIAALTDILDGYLARKNASVSQLGALLDPLADKMLVAAGLLLVVNEDSLWTWMAGLLLCRDIGISSLRMVAMEQGFSISVNIYGKLKTIVQDVMIFCLMINQPFLDLPLKEIGWLCAWAALGLSLWSGWLYAAEFWEKSKHRLS